METGKFIAVDARSTVYEYLAERLAFQIAVGGQHTFKESASGLTVQVEVAAFR